jgi:hypothetical protein
MLRVALAMIAAAGAVTVFLVLPNRGSRRRIPAAWPTGSPDAHFVGGATWRAGGFPFGASWPLVALDLCPEGPCLPSHNGCALVGDTTDRVGVVRRRTDRETPNRSAAITK